MNFITFNFIFCILIAMSIYSNIKRNLKELCKKYNVSAVREKHSLGEKIGAFITLGVLSSIPLVNLILFFASLSEKHMEESFKKEIEKGNFIKNI